MSKIKEIKTSEAARIIGVTLASLRGWVYAGEVQAIKRGGRLYFGAEEVERLAAQHAWRHIRRYDLRRIWDDISDAVRARLARLARQNGVRQSPDDAAEITIPVTTPGLARRAVRGIYDGVYAWVDGLPYIQADNEWLPYGCQSRADLRRLVARVVRRSADLPLGPGVALVVVGLAWRDGGPFVATDLAYGVSVAGGLSRVYDAVVMPIGRTRRKDISVAINCHGVPVRIVSPGEQIRDDWRVVPLRDLVRRPRRRR